jgi:tetrahydromethanopterin S-methyltransferase subunit F
VRVDLLQRETQQGPWLDRILGRGSFRTGDLAAERDRWPLFGARVADEVGVRSMVALRLSADDDTLGSLALYAATVDAIDDVAVGDAAGFAAYAALALDRVRHLERAANLERALESNRLIGVALGILMARLFVTEPEAFTLLKGASQNSNRKLAAVAEDVVQTGTLPEVSPGRRQARPA